MNLQKFHLGEAFDTYEYFGAHIEKEGIVFRTYAPNAHRITIVGQWNEWQEQPLKQLHQSGVWSICCSNAKTGQMYKYVIYGENGRTEHCDSYGFGMELRPGACSIIRDLSEYTFTDAKWLKKRTHCFDKPLNIYELHLGSWKLKDGKWYTYNEITDELIPYLKQHGYNYVEFMPISEHPFDGSWGYQNTGFFSPTSRYGTAAQLMELIDKLHNADIGAILDFVPVHFAVDTYGLKEYDGTALYEYPHKDVENGGLGFDYKWDLGWMHDTLDYFSCHPYDRTHMTDKITFSIFYGYNERYILPFSHDEVVHGKKTIIEKLNGSYEEKFAQARLLYLYMMIHPGKKPNFMGNEIAMFREWDEKREPDWELLKLPAHDAFHHYIEELNQRYLKGQAFWEFDHTYEGFKWVDCKTENKCVFAYTRNGKTNNYLVIFNFSNKEALIKPEINGRVTMLLNTDWEPFGGKTPKSRKRSITKTLPPFSGILYKY